MALMLCPECASEVSDQAVSCPKCGLPLGGTPTTPTKPTVGIVVAGVLGVIGLWWALSSFTPGPLDFAHFALVPALASFTVVSASVNTLGNVSLLVGVGLTALSHQNGPQVVRITCVLMLVATVLLGVAMFSAVSGSLETMDPQVRGGVEGV
jgi:hypothetical protein